MEQQGQGRYLGVKSNWRSQDSGWKTKDRTGGGLGGQAGVSL